MAVEPFEQTFSGGPLVRGFLHIPENASGDGLVLSHGAGSDCQNPLLVALAAAFCDSGLHVLRCDLPFRQFHPHGPPPRGSAEQDQAGVRRAAEAMRQQLSGIGRAGRIYLGGHSYGGRQSSIVTASEPELADGLLLLAYPLHPPKRPEQLRISHFPELRTPALFVHGTRDGFASIEELTEARKLIPAATELLTIMGAGHDLRPMLTGRNRDRLVPMVVSEFQKLIGRTSH